MARKTKATVDYFPHVCNHGETMFIVEQRYGNDGYAFWFKLLETLGTSEGHCIDLGNPTTWEFLQAKTRVSESFCTDILDLLAKLGAIDRELWESAKVVWSQKFVDGIADAYRNRTLEIPVRPSFYCKKPASGGVSDVRNPQIREEKKKLKKIREEESIDVVVVSACARVRLAEIVALWEENKPGTIGKYTLDTLAAWIEDDGMEPDLIIFAIERAIAAGALRLDYVEGVLSNLELAGITTRQQAEAQTRGKPKAKEAKEDPHRPPGGYSWEGKTPVWETAPEQEPK